jgi:hypothetical protein
MNERIKELAEQCYEHDQSWTGVGQRIFNKEKFAELIVKDCLFIIENLSPGYKDYRNQIEDAFRRDCMEEIKSQYGIE